MNALPPSALQAPAANTAAVATLAAVPGQSWALSKIIWSYNGTPTAGSLTIAWNSASIVLYITSAGPGEFIFPEDFVLPLNTAVVITLAAGGAGVTGTVYPVGSTKTNSGGAVLS